MKAAKRRITGKLSIGIGTMMICAVVLANTLDYHREKELLSSLAQTIQKPVLEQHKESGAASADADGGENKETESIGIMIIPGIDLKAPIQEGVEPSKIRSALGHVPGSALPWNNSGNCVIAGHRNYSFGRFFNRLDEMKTGDELTIVSLDGLTYLYEAEEIKIVEPKDISVLEPTEEATLTLITCTPIYIATHRLIVKCRLIAVV